MGSTNDDPFVLPPWVISIISIFEQIKLHSWVTKAHRECNAYKL